MVRLWLFVLFATCSATAFAGPSDDGLWHAGAYSFSDELGGFHILGASGTGTRDDPIKIVQEQTSASAVTLIIKAEQRINTLGTTPQWANGLIYMRIVTVNNSGLPWVGFGFELQEELGVPSVFSDGLSFDQRKYESKSITMDRFDRYERQFEPFDRLEFQDGTVDPLQRATFGFLISDFTPLERTYLLMDPSVPFS